MKTHAMAVLLGVLTASSRVMAAGQWDCIDLNDFLPFGESSVCSLMVLPDGSVLGGCGGTAAHLFLFDPVKRTVHDLKRWNQPGFVRGLTRDADGRFWLLVGTRPDMILPEKPQPQGAHVWSGVLANGEIGQLRDHGAPFAGEGAGCIVLDTGRKRLYGVAYPTPIVFDYDVAAGTFQEYARLGKREDPERAITWQSPCERVSKCPRTLSLGATGTVYGAWDGQLFAWIPSAPDEKRQKEVKQVKMLKNARIPSADDRKTTEGVIVESLVQGTDGRLYGGTYDGYLFAVDLGQETVANLGKPFRQAHIRALASSGDGRIFGLCGEASGHGRVFTYSSAAGYTEITIQGSKFRSDTLDALAVGPDGTVFVGGAGRMTALYVYRP